jgi:hypothetical protein
VGAHTCCADDGEQNRGTHTLSSAVGMLPFEDKTDGVMHTTQRKRGAVYTHASLQMLEAVGQTLTRRKAGVSGGANTATSTQMLGGSGDRLPAQGGAVGITRAEKMRRMQTPHPEQGSEIWGIRADGDRQHF